MLKKLLRSTMDYGFNMDLIRIRVAEVAHVVAQV